MQDGTSLRVLLGSHFVFHVVGTDVAYSANLERRMDPLLDHRHTGTVELTMSAMLAEKDMLLQDKVF